MSKVRIKWNLPAFEEVRWMPKVADTLGDMADRIAAQCGEGIVGEKGSGSTRARAAVITTTPRAIARNRRDNTILRNADAGRVS